MIALAVGGCGGDESTVGSASNGGSVDDSDSDTDDGASAEGTADDDVDPEDTGSADTGSADPLCDMPDSAANAAFDVAVGDWDISTDEGLSIELEATCSVTAVAVEGGFITTELDCLDAADAIHPVTVQVAATDSGTPSWDTTNAVTLALSGTNAVGGLLPDGLDAEIAVWGFSMRRVADGVILAAGSDQWSTAELFAPLEFTITDPAACGLPKPCSNDENRPLAIRIAEPGGNALDLLGGRRGELELADGTVLHVDAPIAHASSSCETSQEFRLLARRTE